LSGAPALSAYAPELQKQEWRALWPDALGSGRNPVALALRRSG